MMINFSIAYHLSLVIGAPFFVVSAFVHSPKTHYHGIKSPLWRFYYEHDKGDSSSSGDRFGFSGSSNKNITYPQNDDTAINDFDNMIDISYSRSSKFPDRIMGKVSANEHAERLSTFSFSSSKSSEPKKREQTSKKKQSRKESMRSFLSSFTSKIGLDKKSGSSNNDVDARTDDNTSATINTTSSSSSSSSSPTLDPLCDIDDEDCLSFSTLDSEYNSLTILWGEVPSDSLCDAQDIDCQALLSKTYVHSDSFLAADLRSRSESIQSERIYENWMGAHCPTSFVAVSSQDWVRRVDMEAYPIVVCGGARGGVYAVNMEDKNVIAMADDVHSVQVEEKANQSKVHVATEMAKQAMEKLYGKIDGGGVILVAISGNIVASSGREGGTCLWKLERYSALPPVENQEQGLDRESSASHFGILSKLAGNTGKGKNSDRTEFKTLNDAVEGKLQPLGYLPGLEKTIVTCLKFDSKQRLWAGCYDGTTRAYDVSKCTQGNFRISSQKHLFRSDFTDSVLDMSLCEEIGIGACATADGGVALFSLDHGQFFVGLMLFESPTRSVLILKRKNGGYAVCCGGSNGQIHMIPLNVDLESNKVDEDNPFLVSESTDTSIKPTAHTGPVMSLSSANEGITEGMFISAGQDGTVRVWDSNIDDASVGGTDVVGTEPQPCSAKCLYALTGYKLWLSRAITDGRVIVSDGGENSIIMRNFAKERRPDGKANI